MRHRWYSTPVHGTQTFEETCERCGVETYGRRAPRTKRLLKELHLLCPDTCEEAQALLVVGS